MHHVSKFYISSFLRKEILVSSFPWEPISLVSSFLWEPIPSLQLSKGANSTSPAFYGRKFWSPAFHGNQSLWFLAFYGNQSLVSSFLRERILVSSLL
ncbi:hypothetical protein V6N13_094327 [Hibiscus sabdariffa]